MIEERDLPGSWSWTNFGQCFEIHIGATPNRKEPNYWGGNIPWVSSGEIKFCHIAKTREYITQAGLDNSSTQINPAGSVLLAMIGEGKTRGQVAILGIDACNNQNSAAIWVSKTPIKPGWIYYWLLSQYSATRKESSGNNQPALNKTRVEQIIFPLAPLSEQQRIVEAIEQQFSCLDQAVALLHQAQKKLKRYRASVLKAAVEGKLTKEWRETHPDIEPASESLKRILAARRAKWEEEQIAKGKDPKKVKYVEPVTPDVRELPGLPEGWCWTTINQIAECLDFKRVPINKEERAKRNGTVPYYGANGQVGWIDDYIFDEALVLVVEDETFLGREIPFSYKVTDKSWVNNHAHVLRATAAVHIDYLNYSLAYYPFTPLTQGTTGRRKLTQKALLLASYALPPLIEQEQIVSLVEERLSIISELEATIEKALKRAERQRQSILHRAFMGKLVPQDPNDEPASVLLERIRREREEQRARSARRKKGDGATNAVKTPDKPAEPIDTTDIAQESLWQSVEA